MLVSVIIPALNEAQNIRQCVDAARREYAGNRVEIVVVDGGSTDGTLDQVPAGVVTLSAPRGRALQMNHGARASRGQLLVFCHADTQLPAGWHEAVTTALSRPGVSGGTFRSRLAPEVGLLRLGNRLSIPAWWPWMLGDQAQLMSRATFEQLGGFPEIPWMEDLEMIRALRRCGRLVRLPLRVTTSSRRFVEHGVLRQTLLDLLLEAQYLLLGVSPEDLARYYVSSRKESV